MNFKTVDNLVDHYIGLTFNLKSRDIVELEHNIIQSIIRYRSDDLLSILNKSTNIPSEYDMLIINEINHTPIWHDKSVKYNHKNILDIYRYRKIGKAYHEPTLSNR